MVVTAIESAYGSRLTIVVYVALIHIAHLVNIRALRATEYLAYLDDRAVWHVDQRSAGESLFITTTVYLVDIATDEVDYGCCLIGSSSSIGSSLWNPHTESVE